MAVTSTGNAGLDNIVSSYTPREDETAQKNDALGRDAFLTMLVAQLKNQDPLNPMDGTDFSAQLAQFSQLEQLMNLNETMEGVAGNSGGGSSSDIMDYIGKEVAGKVDTIALQDGTASSGYFSIDTPAEVKVTVTDAKGNTVRTFNLGQQEAGGHTITWDGKDSSGKMADDGTYTYTVSANYGAGFTDLSSTVSGEVQGVSYSNGNAFLVVNGVLMDPASVDAVRDKAETSTEKPESLVGYLGKTVTSEQPIVQVEDGAVAGTDLSFNLDQKALAVLNILDAAGNLVKTVQISEDQTVEGANTYEWDGTDNSGDKVADGLYQYQVMSRGKLADTPVNEEVAGIKIVNGQQFLELKDSSRLLTLDSVTGIK
ncbi:MAG: flagellar hook capping protein [Desulfobacter sp.]|nr:MAG: flagellar hook capping protein [Desulfobacter sp.]